MMRKTGPYRYPLSAAWLELQKKLERLRKDGKRPHVYFNLASPFAKAKPAAEQEWKE
jgi:hypothetical protein